MRLVEQYGPIKNPSASCENIRRVGIVDFREGTFLTTCISLKKQGNSMAPMRPLIRHSNNNSHR